MKKKTLLLFLTLSALSFLISCGGGRSMAKEEAYAPSKAYAQQSYAQEYQQTDDESVALQSRRASSAPNVVKDAAGKNRPSKKGEEAPEARKVIYSARIEMEIRHLRETQEKILDIMKSTGGFLESQTSDRMAIRVPSENFDAAVAEILKLGMITQKKIFTQDVSDQYDDLERRLLIAEKSKARLLEMLAKVKEVKEKVRIIEEIKRLTQEIESYKSILAAMESFVRYSLIEVILKVPSEREVRSGVSPFGWINSLSPHEITLLPVGWQKVQLKLPPYFLVFKEEPTYLARNPEGAFIRAGKTANEPRGDGEFWKKALDRGMEFKNYENLLSGKKGEVFYSVYRFKSPKPESVLTALWVKDHEIFVIEAFFPGEEIRQAVQPLLIESLSSFEVKP